MFGYDYNKKKQKQQQTTNEKVNKKGQRKEG